MSSQIHLPLLIIGPELDDDELAEASRRLRDELLAVAVDDVRPVGAGPPPEGAKAGEAVALGALLISTTPALVAGIIDVVASWVRRQRIDVEVEIDGQRLKGPVTREQRDALVAVLLRRASSGVTPA